MAIVLYTDAAGIRAFVRAVGPDDSDVSWTQNQGEALIFPDAATANAYLAAHNPTSVVVGQLVVGGDENFGTESLS